MKRMAKCMLAFLLALGVAVSATAQKPVPEGRWVEPAGAFVTVNGVRLHYLDWGGRGEPILLLPGFGDEARIFEPFAPRLADRFRVLALTRRGFGKSDKPARGYDTDTRVEDIRAFLDRLKIDRVHLAGHSMAGDELTLFATKYPQRVRKLVYLDAAINRHHMLSVSLTDPAITPRWKRLFLEAAGSPQASKVVAHDLPPEEERRVTVAYYRAMDAFRQDYRGVKAPALAFYAPPREQHPMAARERDPALRRKMNDWWTRNMLPHFRANPEQFRSQMRRGEVVVLPGADHYVFFGKSQDAVVRKMRAFLLR